MPVLVTCKFNGDWIQSNWEKMDTLHNLIWPKFELIWAFMPVLITCKFDKYLIKGDWEKLETSFSFTSQGHIIPKWLVRSGWNSNQSKILCLSLLPVRLMKIEFIVTEKKWRHHFLHYKSMGKNVHAQGRLTQKWIIRSGPILNSFELLCLSSLAASLTKIQSKVTEKSWRHLFFHCSRACNSKMTGQIQTEFELVRDLPVLVTCKFDDVWIHSNWEKMETPFSPFKVSGNAQGQISLQWKVRSNPNLNSSEILCLSLWPASLTKIWLKVSEKMQRHRFYHYMSMGAFCCHGNHSFDPICCKA